jgi:peptidoglycan/xylan/chitin deacetylase (PgdA/CDA1 family)
MRLIQSILVLLFLWGGSFSVAGAVPTMVMITVDVESYEKGNPDAQIWGKQPDGEHGVRRIMDMLEAHGLKGTFYLNVYEAAKHGEGELASVARAIHERGHDLELHTHPGPMFGNANMRQASLERQVEILQRGQDLIRQWTGKHVVAHRAGAFAGNLDTLRATRMVGLSIDSSVSPAARKTEFARTLPPNNSPRVLEGVVELPVSFYTQAKLGGWRSLHYLDVESSSYDEMVSVIRQFRDAGFPVVTIMMHSFSFVRYGTANAAVEKRFDQLLRFVSTEPGIKPATVSQLYPEWVAQRATLEPHPDLVPHTGLWLTYWRSVEHAREGGLYLALAVSPVVALVVMAIALLWRRSIKRARGAHP